MSIQKVWLTWTRTNILWSKLDLLWSEVFLLIEIAGGGGGTGGMLVDGEDVWKAVDRDLERKGYDKEEREKFFKIVIKVNGLETKSTHKLSEIKKSITVDHIKKTIAQVAPNIKLHAVQVKRHED